MKIRSYVTCFCGRTVKRENSLALLRSNRDVGSSIPAFRRFLNQQRVLRGSMRQNLCKSRSLLEKILEKLFLQSFRKDKSNGFERQRKVECNWLILWFSLRLFYGSRYEVLKPTFRMALPVFRSASLDKQLRYPHCRLRK